MEHTTTESAETEGDETGVLTRQCKHCDWETTAGSHAAMVTAYHDHLRDEHEGVWLRM